MSSISDERGQELLYAGIPISEVFAQDMGIGGVLGLLWFQRRLPPYACKFLEMCLMITADHGPAVSGAHNTIVCARYSDVSVSKHRCTVHYTVLGHWKCTSPSCPMA